MSSKPRATGTRPTIALMGMSVLKMPSGVHAIAQNPQDENALGRDRVIDGMTLVFIAAYTVFDMAEIATDAGVVGNGIKARA
jgi:hypothetical protein